MGRLHGVPGALEAVAALWDRYFPKEVLNPLDSRLDSVSILMDMFDGDLEFILGTIDSRRGLLPLTMPYILSRVPFDDFAGVLIGQPCEVLGCMGLAASVLLVTQGHTPKPRPILIVISNLGPPRPFHEIKSNTVGQLVTVMGYVVRVGASRPLVTEASFKCPKCSQITRCHFEDGIFAPPSVCSTDKCYNRYLELERDSIGVTDYQRIKLQEIEDRDAARIYNGMFGEGIRGNAVIDSEVELTSGGAYNPRVPRTFDIEARGAHLVDQCVAGDVLVCVGEVKMMQTDVPRGGRGRGGGSTEKESGIHVMYIVANSVRTTRAGESPSAPVLTSNGTKKRSLNDIASDDDAKVSDIYRAKKLQELSDITSNDDTPVSEIYRTSKLQRSLNSYGVNSNAGSTTARSVRSIAEAGALTVPWLVSSLCPLIYGHELVKLGLLLGLFGGTPSEAYRTSDPSLGIRHAEGIAASVGGAGFSTRSDIHVLVVGDPGLGKSQLLRSAAAVAPKAVFVCGNTATTAGLTVSLSRDTGGGRGGGGSDVCIEAGALVLADKGVCCIDELDKMSCDPHSMLEAMEQQQISVAKSGVVTSLKSRSTILAAANPVGGHYNRNKSVCENLKMASALLSRFDLVFILLDKPDEGHDRRISEHIMGITRASKSVESGTTGNAVIDDVDPGLETLSQRLHRQCTQCSEVHPALGGSDIRKYIEFARSHVQPKLSPAAAKVLQKMYLTMRSHGVAGDGIDSAASGAMPVTTRHLESLIRLAQARARMELRNTVTENDASDVVCLLHESILDTLTSELGVIDIGRKGGMSLAKQVKAVVSTLGRIAGSKGSNIFTQKEIADVYASLCLPSLSAPKGARGATGQARTLATTAVSALDVESIIEVMRNECYVILKGPRLYQLQLH